MWCKLVFTSLKKGKLGTAAICLQVFIAVVTLIFSYGFINDVYVKVKNAEKALSKNTYIINNTLYSQDYMAENFGKSVHENEELNSILTAVGNSGKVKWYGFYISDTQQSIYKIKLDKSFMEHLNLKLTSGRLFEDGDFKESNIIPVIVSNDLPYKLNQEFTQVVNNQEIKYKVIGIADNSNMVWIHSNFLVEELKNTIILPIQTLDDETYSNLYLEFSDNNSAKAFFESQKNIDKSMIEGYYDGIFKLIDQKKQDLFYIGCFSIVLFIMVAAGTLTFFIISTSKRMHEFGIRFSLGATKGEILKQLFTEQFILFNFTYFISIFIYGKIQPLLPTGGGVTVDLNVLILVYVSLLIILLFITLSILNFLSKFKPIELIRGA